jgi:hypothetical protein
MSVCCVSLAVAVVSKKAKVKSWFMFQLFGSWTYLFFRWNFIEHHYLEWAKVLARICGWRNPSETGRGWVFWNRLCWRVSAKDALMLCMCVYVRLALCTDWALVRKREREILNFLAHKRDYTYLYIWIILLLIYVWLCHFPVWHTPKACFFFFCTAVESCSRRHPRIWILHMRCLAPWIFNDGSKLFLQEEIFSSTLNLWDSFVIPFIFFCENFCFLFRLSGRASLLLWCGVLWWLTMPTPGRVSCVAGMSSETYCPKLETAWTVPRTPSEWCVWCMKQ